mgnify:CR=1 FL=1|jgi:hypothetical protein|tara:strand:- start:8745 stop:9233 length:489 start_codon:yes stop_codon:yes gene_type:complete
MNIIELSKKLYSEKPKPACTQRISLIEGHSLNEQFEIISLVVLEGLEKKLVCNPAFDKCEDKRKFILRMTILLKLYLASVGVRLNIELVSKKDIKGVKLVKSPNFWKIKKYKMDLNCLYKHYKNGKETILYYNPKSKLTSINDGMIIVKIGGNCLKITFKQY